MIARLIRLSVRNPAITLMAATGLVLWGWWSWTTKSVDAIPDISENQVVVMTEWPGHSPQDVEDQITYPLSTALSGVRGVKEVRSHSGFGFSQVYVVVNEPLRLFQRNAVADFYESRTRVLEKLSGIQQELPEGVVPRLGPDATALGQIFWYTVDGPYDLATLRSLQDYVVRYQLQALPGVAEVAGVGGMLREYQVDVDPDLLRYYGASVLDVVHALSQSNRDVGAKTVEQAGVEFVLRGLGFVRGLADVEETPVGFLTKQGFQPAGSMGAMSTAMGAGPEDQPQPHRPVLVRDVGRVSMGPAFRRGAMADDQGEVVGGVVVMRYGANPRVVASDVWDALAKLNDPAAGILPPGVFIRPFYDRIALIDETVETLEHAVKLELWITLAVVLLFMLHLRSSLIVAAVVPIAVLLTLGLMKMFGVDANIMSLTGIAIAIGTMVDMGVVMCENINRALEENDGHSPSAQVVENAAVEVGPALLTAVATTVISFLPIFFLTDQEGKLFRPLAWTKTFALVSATLTGVLLVPVLCRLWLLGPKDRGFAGGSRRSGAWILGAAVAGLLFLWIGPEYVRPWVRFLSGVVGGGFFFAYLGRERLIPMQQNPLSRLTVWAYEPTLRWILTHKATFMLLPLAIVLAGSLVVFGGRTLTAPLRAVFGSGVDRVRMLAYLDEKLPGIGTEFMPPLDEGTRLYMPSLLPRASLNQSLAVLQRQNAAFVSIPEVARVVGKVGRAESALDPAPVGMIETFVSLKPRDMWRPGVHIGDVVSELTRLGHTPGLLEGAGAWLQPIETRVIMLNSGIRAPLAVKLIGTPRGPGGEALDAKQGVLELERVAGEVLEVIRDVPGLAGPTVENLGGKSYVHVEVDRDSAGHYGVSSGDVQDVLQVAVGGMVIDRAIEGRERYGMRVAYPRELRDRVDALENVLVRGSEGAQVPLAQVVSIDTTTGPAAIKTEDGQLRLHVTFAAADRDEGSLMREVLARVADWRGRVIGSGGRDPIPAGVAVEPAGRFEAQERARDRFSVLLPICVTIILFLLYLRFRSALVSLLVFSALPVTVAGGFALIAAWPTIQDQMFAWGLWELPSTGPVYLTVAVVVGFIALAGIATDDGVVMSAYLEQVFERRKPGTVDEVREAVVEAGLRRIRPCLMTTFTTILALYPILASSGRGSDVAQPMALPAVGGMLAGLVSLFIVPCLYGWACELKLRLMNKQP